MRKIIVLLGLLFFGAQFSHGQSENPFSFESSYTADVYANIAGGIRRGGGYMGMGNIKIGFDIEKAGWWSGGSLFINGASIHGRSLSENFLGDLQVASNIDAGNHLYLHELWFRQEFGKLSFTLGLQDLNADFLTSDNGGQFINSSFGVMPVVSCNVPLPIFPLTGLGISAGWDIDDRFRWQAALFDGCPIPFENNNPHNLNWRFHNDDGMFVVTEFHSRFHIFEGREGTCKIGAYYHTGLRQRDEETGEMSDVFRNTYGCYLIADQTLFERGNRKIGLFAMVGAAPRKKSGHTYCFGLGANCYGIFSREGRDALGLGATSVDILRMNGAEAESGAIHSHETAIELYYKYRFTDNITVQPDIQYIINPSGAAGKLSDAIVGILRIGIGF